MSDYGRGGEVVRRRCVIPASCTVHGGVHGFTNVAVSKHNDGIIVDPHVTGNCVLTFDEDAATALRDMLIAWLR